MHLQNWPHQKKLCKLQPCGESVRRRPLLPGIGKWSAKPTEGRIRERAAFLLTLCLFPKRRPRSLSEITLHLWASLTSLLPKPFPPTAPRPPRGLSSPMNPHLPAADNCWEFHTGRWRASLFVLRGQREAGLKVRRSSGRKDTAVKAGGQS